MSRGIDLGACTLGASSVEEDDVALPFILAADGWIAAGKVEDTAEGPAVILFDMPSTSVWKSE